MRTIAHISDLHFGRIDRAVVKALLADLRARRPDVIVVSGDLTQRARRREFRRAHVFLKHLPAPVLVVPGNHDIPAHNLLERFTAPLARYRHYITPDLYPMLVDDEVAMLGINTARPLMAHWNWAHGSISHSQIDHVRAAFCGMPDTVLKVVVTHHPFLPPPDAVETRLVARASRALRAFAGCGVDLLLAGHLHRAYTGDITSHHREIGRAILVAQASTATSTRLRAEPNAYNWIRVDGNTVHFSAVVWHGTEFRPEVEQTFVREPGGWVRRRVEVAETADPESAAEAMSSVEAVPL